MGKNTLNQAQCDVRTRPVSARKHKGGGCCSRERIKKLYTKATPTAIAYLAVINCKHPKMILDTIFPSDPYSALNDSLCKSQDIFYFNFNQEAKSSGSLMEWIAYEGGIAFYAVICILFSLLVLALFNLLRLIFPWQFLTKRFNGCDIEPLPKKAECPSSWISNKLSIDDQVVGKDGATYLWFKFRLIIVYSCIFVISIFLIILHLFGEKQGPYKHISSTCFKNIGLNVIHIVCYVVICVVLICMMFSHVQERKIQSLLASPSSQPASQPVPAQIEFATATGL